MIDATATGRIEVTRIFDAPRERVFAAWTEPDQVAAWFGPDGFDTPRERVLIEPCVGGRYELVMVRRDTGAEHPVRYEIAELLEPELIVLRSGPMPEMGLPEGTMTRVELREDGGRTRMTLSDGPFPPEGAGHAQAGWVAALDKLARLVGR